MKLVDFPADRHVVQFMNERENHVYAAAMAIPAYRTEVSDHTVITFYEARDGQPEPIRDWYYPGDNFGQEFVYPKDHLAEIAAVPNDTTPTVFESRSPAPSPVTATQPVSEAAPVAESPAPVAADTSAPVEIAQATPPAQPAPVAAPQNEPPTEPSELPKTSSNVGEVAILGLIFLGGAAAARKVRLS
jgi:hypothetical protein